MKDKEKHSKDEGHNHDHGGIFGKNTELYFAILSGFCLITGYLLEKNGSISSNISFGLYISAYFFGGYFTLKEAITKISKGEFEIDFLMPDFNESKNWSDRFNKEIFEILLQNLGKKVIRAASDFQDMEEATDVIFDPIRVACRVRSYSYKNYKNDFTIRSERAKQKTEFKKTKVLLNRLSD